MKKKFYFNSIWQSVIYTFIAMILLLLIILCFFIDEIHSGVLFIITILSIGLLANLFWIGFSLSMRIQIDYAKEELYIRHPNLLKRINFNDIVSIQIIEFDQLSFDFIITTKHITKKLAYSRYYKKKVTKERILKVNELKYDLISISNKNINKT